MENETQESLFEELGLSLDAPQEESDLSSESNLSSEFEDAEIAAEVLPPEIELTVAKDSMTAYVKVKPSFHGQEVTYEFIHDFLVENGIVYGILTDAIKEFCDAKKYYLELICAQGLEQVDEENGTLEFLFRKDNAVKPKEKEDGTVDFRDLGLVQNVSKGDVLCRLNLPVPGRDGINIYDKVVLHTQGALPDFPSGTNTVLSEDKLSLLADIDGCVVFKNGSVYIEDVFILRGDVDNSSGNIDFVGSVVIQGDVREGFYVKAGLNVAIRGMAEGATIEAGGDIAISSGMNGMGKGKLIAGGNIVGKFFENVTIECKGDIYADVLMNSRVTTAASIILKGKNALLIGGIYQAGLKIYANTIGSTNHIHTELLIVSDKLSEALYGNSKEDSLETVQNKLSIAQKGAKKLQDQISLLTANPSPQGSTPEGREALKTAITRKAQFATLVGMLEKNIQRINEVKQSFADFKIIGLGITYPGTKITIANFVLRIENDYNSTKFYADSDHIIFAQILPSDRIEQF